MYVEFSSSNRTLPIRRWGPILTALVTATITFFKIIYNKTVIKAGFHWRRSRSRKNAFDLVKIENRSRKRSHELDGIGVGKIRTVSFSSDSAYDSNAYDPVKTRLSESQAEAEEPTNHKARFILRLPLTTPTI